MTNISANDELFGRYLDGMADEGDIAVLRERLLADAEAADSLVAIARFETLIHSHLVDTNRSREVEGLLDTNAPTNQTEAIPALSPLPSLSTIHHPLPTNFVDGPVFSYMVASVVVCLMLLGAWAYKITQVEMVVEDKPAINTIDDSEYKVVGRVTDMKDCVWAEDGLMTMAGASVPLGREYALSSGLIELTYVSGAKVILEGPCRYKVDSRAGGFLERGKLTARVDNAKPQAASSESPAPSPQAPVPLFTVTTPTAVVTDLGTEFGVEVSEDGATISHVFQGSVKVQVVNGGDQRQCIVLCENETARIGRVGEKGTGLITILAAGGEPRFARQMPSCRLPGDDDIYAELVLSLRPAVYYRMERPSAGLNHNLVFDSSGGSHHGDLRLGDVRGRPYRRGRWGDALWFRGSGIGDMVFVPDYPKAKNGTLTVSAWVMAVPWMGYWPRIAGSGMDVDGKNVSGQFRFSLSRSGSDLAVQVLQHDGAEVDLSEDHAMPLSEWQHVAFVADGNMLRLYRNGEEVAATECEGVMPDPFMRSLTIGSKISENVRKHCWCGLIDELAVFNMALSADQIRRLYAADQSDLPGETASKAATKKTTPTTEKGGDR